MKIVLNTYKTANLFSNQPAYQSTPEFLAQSKERHAETRDYYQALKSYALVSFGGKKTPMNLREQVHKIGIQNVPQSVLDKIETVVDDNLDDGSISLYKLHKEVYRPLLDCETLEEAKILYPEFGGVKQFSEVTFSHPHCKGRKIQQGRFKDLPPQDASLILLKKIYAEAHSIAYEPEAYCGMAYSAIRTIMNEIQLPPLNRNYAAYLTNSNDEINTQRSISLAEKRKSKEFNEANLVGIRQSNSSPKVRKQRSEYMIQYHKDHPEEAEIFQRAMQSAWDENAELKAKMGEVAKDYPAIGGAVKKAKKGALTGKDILYLRKFFKLVRENNPEHDKVFSESLKKWLKYYREEYEAAKADKEAEVTIF